MGDGVLVMPTDFRPDVVDTITDEDMESDVEAGANRRDRRWRELPGEVTAIRLQLLAVQVMSGLRGLLPSPAGGVYLISSVVDGLGSEPIVFQGQTYRGIRDGDLLPLGPANDPSAVLNLYLRENELPRALSFCMLVTRSNQDLRDIGTAIGAAMADDRYEKLADIVTAAATAANPAYATVLRAAQEAIGLLASHLKVKPDDQLGYYQANYTNRFDNLGVGRHPANTRTFEVDKIRVAYQIDAS